jgi:hypothetical protein
MLDEVETNKCNLSFLIYISSFHSHEAPVSKIQTIQKL